MTKEQMRQMAEMVAANMMLCTKEVLTTEEAARYMGVKVSYLYKLTMNGEIPHSKPAGKMCYFRRKDVEEWMTGNPVRTARDLAMEANTYCMRHKSPINKP